MNKSYISFILFKILYYDKLYCSTLHYPTIYHTTGIVFNFFTLFWTMNPVIAGLIMPGTVATVFDKPIIKLAYWGAISKWFTLYKKI